MVFVIVVNAMPTITPLLAETYYAMILNSCGSHAYRDLFALVDGEKKNITEHGNLSCAFFVSSLLRSFGLIKDLHSTVRGTLRDMEQSGWHQINTPSPGCIIYWEARKERGAHTAHEHIGFYINEGEAISNVSKRGIIARHHITYGIKKDGSPSRNILAYYTHPLLR